MSFASKKILITGGLGFIGSNLAIRLVKEGADVTLVDSLIPEYGGNLWNVKDIENDVSINISDVRDEHAMKFLIKDKDYLFNLAGQTSHLDSMNDPYADLEINCRAQLSILEACRHHNPSIKIVFAGTRQIYGKPESLPVDERHLIAPVDVNGINKTAGESYHIVYNNVYGIRSTVLRLTNTYGPRMRVKDARQTFLGIWIKQLLDKEKISVYGSGEQLRDFNYVDDVVNALLLCAENENTNGEVYNLGCEDPLTLEALAQLMIEINGEGEYQKIAFPEARKTIDIGDYYADYRKIRARIGWKPEVSLHEGLKKTIEYYTQHTDHYWSHDEH